MAASSRAPISAGSPRSARNAARRNRISAASREVLELLDAGGRIAAAGDIRIVAEDPRPEPCARMRAMLRPIGRPDQAERACRRVEPEPLLRRPDPPSAP